MNGNERHDVPAVPAAEHGPARYVQRLPGRERRGRRGISPGAAARRVPGGTAAPGGRCPAWRAWRTICLDGYPREAFVADLVREAAADIRGALDKGAHCVQIDFTEGRLAVKLDPSGQLLRSFIELNNQVLAQFSAEERRRIGVHTCPGGDQDSTHSADVDYAELLPSLFDLNAGSFYLQLASETDRGRVLGIIKEHARPGQMIFVGVIDPINPTVETPEEVRDRVLEAAGYLDPDRLGTCDDCGFSPFGDDTSTAREIAFEKIRARVVGTELAGKELAR